MRRRWSETERDLLRRRYPCEPTERIAADLGRTLRQVYMAARALGLGKTPEYLAAQYEAKRGKSTPGMQTHQFRKGHVPANKGRRMPGWAPGRMAETQFRKGERTGAAASNWRPIGTILADHEGYLRIKIREAEYGREAFGFGNTKVWPLYQRYLWEQANGPIPPKHIVRFKDGNRSNCALDNLELISMAENARRNHWKNLPPELAHAIMLTGAIKRKLRERSAKEEHNRGPAGSPVRDAGSAER